MRRRLFFAGLLPVALLGAVLVLHNSPPAVGNTAGTLASDLNAPVRISVGEEPIDVEIGHAAPYFADFDGDGLADLLVGQFGGGKLRVYRNVGTAQEPAYKDFEWFQAGGEDGKVPSG